MNNCCPVKLEITSDDYIDLTVSVDDDVGITIGEYIATATNYETYTGQTTITPTQSTQVLNTSNKVVLNNITINPIPSNYGLISWNGSYLTVS